MAEPTVEELKAQLAKLQAELNRPLSCKVGDKGGVSVYGLGRFPVTLYYEQWNKLLDFGGQIREFMEKNKHLLKLKE